MPEFIEVDGHKVLVGKCPKCRRQVIEVDNADSKRTPLTTFNAAEAGAHEPGDRWRLFWSPAGKALASKVKPHLAFGVKGLRLLHGPTCTKRAVRGRERS